jgi:hypothetical protein
MKISAKTKIAIITVIATMSACVTAMATTSSRG